MPSRAASPPAAAYRRELGEAFGLDRAPRRLVAGELDRWEWVGVDRLDDYLIPRLARRVRSATALDATTGAYLEHGRPITTNER